MNIIIRLILDIFQAIFEKDAAERSHRQRQSRHGPPPVPRQRQQQQQRQGGGRSRNLDAWIEDLVDDELPETRQPTRPKPRPLAQPLSETFAQHSAATALSMGALDRHVDAYLGDVHYEQEGAREFVLPGNNPMVQLVLAQEILGPPKGRRR